MQLLDAVNLMLPKVGERPVTSLEVNHPTLALILPEVDNAIKAALLKGWWFNEFKYTAHPALDGTITLGADTLAFVPLSGQPLAVLRGLALFNPETLDYVWTAPVKGIVTQNLPFELLPESAAQYVWFSSLVNVYATDLGVAQELQVWGGQAQAAYTDMLAEHLRQRKYSTKNSARFQRLRSAMRA